MYSLGHLESVLLNSTTFSPYDGGTMVGGVALILTGSFMVVAGIVEGLRNRQKWSAVTIYFALAALLVGGGMLITAGVAALERTASGIFSGGIILIILGTAGLVTGLVTMFVNEDVDESDIVLVVVGAVFLALGSILLKSV